MPTITFTIPDATLTTIVSETTTGSWESDFQRSGLTAKQYVARKMLHAFMDALKAKKRGEIVRSRQQEGMTEFSAYAAQVETAKSGISAT